MYCLGGGYKRLEINRLQKHRNWPKFLPVWAVITLLVCLLSASLPFNIISQTASAADSLFYDFIAEADNASWMSGAGSLPFPGSDSDNRGFALFRDGWQLEDNSTRARALETHPQWVASGWIMGKYPQLTVPADAELKITVGFFKGATGSDGVIFKVQFEEGQTTQTLLTCGASYDNKLDTMTQSLDSLEGKTGRFILFVSAGQSSGQDWAAWAEAKIEVAAPSELPDLVVTDIEQDGNDIRYQIENIGEGSVINPVGGKVSFCNALFIDDELVATDCVNITEMAPGEDLDNAFDYDWEMTQPQHAIRVCADWEQDVDEESEQNNCWEETWHLEGELPDLVIEEIICDRENSRIGYTVKNIGEAAAPSVHATILFVNDEAAGKDIVDIELEPGEIYKSWFDDYIWPDCQTIEVKVCADGPEEVEESNEQNNYLEKTCQCVVDTTPLAILSGPTVSEVTQTSAVICWETDKASDSLVKYDNHSGKYGAVTEDPGMGKEHCLSLPNLDPGTTYHFVVESRDSSGNKAGSRDLNFETLAYSDEESPSLSLLAPEVLSGKAAISAATQDNGSVDRVVFLLDGKPVFTDFTSPFEWECDAGILAEGLYDVGAQAFTPGGLMDETHFDRPVQNSFPLEDSPVWVTIDNPVSWSEVSGWVEIRATISHEYCQHIVYSEIVLSSATSEDVVDPQDYPVLPWHGPGPPPCADPVTVSYFWDTSELALERYIVKVVGRDEFGNEGDATALVSLVEPPSVELALDIDRDVTREGNYFQVELTVRNTGSETVHDFTVTDVSRGFQGVRNSDVVVTYDTVQGGAVVKKSMGTFRPGNTCTLNYELVPVLFHPSLGESSYRIGESLLGVSYEDEYEREYSREYASPCWSYEGSQVNAAFSSADYLIVTNPHRLFESNPVGDVNQLLARMAELAKEKQGVLGYLERGARAEDLDRLIDARGSGDDRWFLKLCDGWTTEGYLLIVGEEEIVPSFAVNFTVGLGGSMVRVPLTDYPYSDSGGDEGRPELPVGRIIGNTAFELVTPIKTSLDVSRGVRHMDRSDALVVVSQDKPHEYFIQWATPLIDGLIGDWTTVTSVKWEYQDTEKGLLREALAILGSEWDLDSLPSGLNDLRDLVGRWDLEDETTLPEPPDDLTTLRGLISVGEAERVQAAKRGESVRHYTLHPDSSQMLLARAHLVGDNAYDRGLICYVGHGGSGGWVWGLDEPHLSFIGFGTAAPVVFAAACESGDYETGWTDDDGIAEAFLRRGAAVYMGAVISIGGGSALEMQKRFCLTEWTPSRSVGESLIAVKRNLIAIDNPSNPEWLRMAYIWNLYGDPKYGQ